MQPNKFSDRILLIESDNELSLSITRLLNKQNFNVCLAEHDEQAKKHLDEAFVECIIYGLNQPLHESLLHLKKLLVHTQNPCVLILSSFDWQEVESFIGDIKYSKFVTKPIKQDKFLQLITQLKNIKP